MWPKADNIDLPFDTDLIAYLAAGGVTADRLPVAEHRTIEFAWRQVYHRAFTSGGRFRHDSKAVYAYLRERPASWLLVPFLSGVPGTAVHVVRPTASAFACTGPLPELGDFINVEFFVSPPDLSWTFVRTHEDFTLGGPYFTRANGSRVRGTPADT
jgi:hypothetical protein